MCDILPFPLCGTHMGSVPSCQLLHHTKSVGIYSALSPSPICSSGLKWAKGFQASLRPGEAQREVQADRDCHGECGPPGPSRGSQASISHLKKRCCLGEHFHTRGTSFPLSCPPGPLLLRRLSPSQQQQQPECSSAV